MKNYNNDTVHCINVIKEGGIILYPTDTIWGIGCDATNAIAIKKIYDLKQREESKSLIILLSSKDEIEKYVLHPSKKIIDFIDEQKNPTTAIFTEAIHLPKEIISSDGSIAIRIVQDDFCKTLIQRLQLPLVSTSANISGDSSPKNFSEINDAIKNGVDYIVQHRQKEMQAFQPSSIIKLNSLNEIEKIR